MPVSHREARRAVARDARLLARQFPGNPTDRILVALVSLDARIAALEAAMPAAALAPDDDATPNEG